MIYYKENKQIYGMFYEIKHFFSKGTYTAI